MSQPIPGPLPYATATLSGIVSTADQVFGGHKVFTGNVIVQGTLSTPAGTLNLAGGPTTSGTAVAAVINAVYALTMAGDRLLSVRNNNVERFAIDKDGGLRSPTGQTLTLKSGAAVAATAFTVIDTDQATPSTAGAALLSIRKGGVEQWWIDKDGLTPERISINVKAAPFYAKGDGVTDDWLAIQSALNSIPLPDSAEYTQAAVYMPPGKYYISKPLKIQQPFTELRGAGISSTTITTSNGVAALWQGPTIFVTQELYGGARKGLTLASSLVTGPGSSMRVDTTSLEPVYLAPTNDIPMALDFNFYSNPSTPASNQHDLTVEFWMKIDLTDPTVPGNPVTVMASVGNVPGEPNFSTMLFAISLNTDGAGNYGFGASYTYQATVGVPVAVNLGTTQTFAKNVVYHMALVMAPSLNAVTLYVNGVQAGQVALPANVKPYQHPFETLQFGDRASVFYPDGDTSTLACFKGWLDGIRISSVARYSAPFSPPTSKFIFASQDHDCKFLLNFDQFYGQMPIAQGWQYGPFGLPFTYYLRARGAVVNNSTNAIELRDFTAASSSGTGIVIQSSVHAKIADVRVNGALRGLEFNENSYILDVNRFWAETSFGNYVWDQYSVSGREGILSRGAVGFGRFANIYTTHIIGGTFIRPGVLIDNWDQLGGDALIYGLMFIHADEFDSASVRGWAIDLETGTAAALKGAVYMNGVRSASFTDCALIANAPDLHPTVGMKILATPAGAYPPDQLTMNNCSFIVGVGNTVFDVVSGKASIVLENCKSLYGFANVISNHPEMVTSIGGDLGPSIIQALELHSPIANGASAVGLTTDTQNALTTDGAKLLSVKNNNVEKFAINKDGKTVSGGFPFTETDSAVDATVSSAVFTLMTGMALTLPFNGHYLINFDGTGSTDTNGATLTYAIFKNGVIDADTERHKDSQQANMDGTIHITDILHSAAAGDTVEVRWKVSAGNATVHQRCFSLIRFGP